VTTAATGGWAIIISLRRHCSLSCADCDACHLSPTPPTYVFTSLGLHNINHNAVSAVFTVANASINILAPCVVGYTNSRFEIIIITEMV